MNEAVIPVFFNTDNDYIVPTYIALFSLLYNYRGAADIHAYILNAGDISEKNMHLMSSLSDRFPVLTIKFLRVKHDFRSASIKLPYVTKASMYRLLIPGIAEELPEICMDRCIYLDADLVVTGDIAELFSVDITGFYIAGVADVAQISPERNILRDILAIPSMVRYINAGVLLMNLKEINCHKGLREQLEASAKRDDFPYNDQDALNSVLYEGIKLLPQKYNVRARNMHRTDREYCHLYGKENVTEARKSPVVIHYMTETKPWSYKTTLMAEEWWKYAGMQDKNTFDEYIRPFLNAHRLPLRMLAIEKCRTTLKRLGIFNLRKKLMILLQERICGKECRS